MIDFDLIQQTVTETIDWQRPWWLNALLPGVSTLVIVMAIANVLRMVESEKRS